MPTPTGSVRIGVSSATALVLTTELESHLGGLAGASAITSSVILDALNEAQRECNARGMLVPKVVEITATASTKLYELPTDCAIIETIHLEDETNNAGGIREFAGWRQWNDGALRKLSLDGPVSAGYTLRVYYHAEHAELTGDSSVCYAPRRFTLLYVEYILFDRHLRTGNKTENDKHLARLETAYEGAARRLPKHKGPGRMRSVGSPFNELTAGSVSSRVTI